MAENIYLDNAQRKRIVTFWIPVCLGFLHLWATGLWLGMITPAIQIGHDYISIQPYAQPQLDTIYKAFKTCQYAIWGLILLLISDKALEFMIERAGNLAGAAVGKTIQTTETKTVTTTPAVTAVLPDVAIKAENVNVNTPE